MDRASFIRALKYDVWGLQECEARPQIGAPFLVSAPSTKGRDKNVVIASQFKLFDPYAPTESNSIACIVDAPTPFVFGSLWSFDTEARKGRYQKYIDASKEMMDGFIEYANDLRLPLIAVGDFNMSLGHIELTQKARTMQQEMYAKWHEAGLRSAYHEEMGAMLGEEPEATVFGKSQGGKWEYHIDYIWFDCSAFSLQTAKLHERQYSDHTPLTATFSAI
jgi:endonuclease/exonuclease/phosphatase family metal-dependent hydrolase